MSYHFTPDKRLREYLLDDLDESDRARVEEEYFRNDGVFEELTITEDELIDDYVAGELSAEEHERFERAFLTTPARRDRVAFARSLQRAVARGNGVNAPNQVVSEAGWWTHLIAPLRATGVNRWAIAAAVLVLVVSVPWLALERRRLQSDVATLQAERGALLSQAQQLQERLESERVRAAETLAAQRRSAPVATSEPSGGGAASRAAAPIVASFVLTPHLVRGVTESNSIRIAPGTALLRLQMELEADTHPRYRPVLETVAGEQIWTQHAVPAESRAGGRIVTIELPASVLANRDYILTLRGEGAARQAEDVAAYSFRVSRQ